MRKGVVLALLVAFALCAALPALAVVYLPPDSHPRLNSQAVWANGMLHWYGGYGNLVTNPVTGQNYDANRESGYSVYNPVTDSWKSSKWSDDPQDPAGIDNNGDGVLSASEGTYPGTSQSFAYDSDSDGTQELYVHAGYPVWDGNFFRYDPDTNVWTSVGSTSNFFGGGYMAQYLGVAAIDSTTGKVYCAGGGFWGATNDSFAVFDLAAETWTILPTLPVTFMGQVGAVINGKLYIAGGTQGGAAAQSAIYAYDIAAGTWNTTPVANLLTGVDRPGVFVYNNKLYIVGGQDASAADIADIQVFDPATNSVAVAGTLPIGMSRQGAAIDPATGDMYVGAGRQAGATPATEKWWKANVNVTPFVWSPIADDPAYFPYTDWYAGGEALSGVVTGPDGSPMAGAVVGVKKTSRGDNAAADAQFYALTDGLGRYSVDVPPGDYNVAAWKIRYAPSADVPVTMGTVPGTCNAQITAVAGANIAPGSTVYFSTEDTSNVAANAIDDDLGTRWSTPTGPNQWYIIDLGSVKPITGLTIFWETALPGVYSISLTNDDPDPAGTAAWTTAYDCVKGGGGFSLGYGYFVEAIRMATGTAARGVKITLSAYGSWPSNYSAYEFIVHGDAVGPPPFQTVQDVKALPDDTPVELMETIAASGAGNGGASPIFPNTFWIESADRSSGIRCEFTDPWAFPGEYDYIKGVMKTDTETGERYIQVSEIPLYMFLGQGVNPVGMTNKAASDLMPAGTLVKLWGKVTEQIIGGYKIDDGSSTPVTVVHAGPAPQVGTFMTVSGALAGGSKLYEWPFDGYVRSWLVNGGYSVADPGTGSLPWQQANLDQDFLAGEATISPQPGDVAPNGASWFIASIKPWETDYNFSVLPLQASGQGQSTAYASVWIWSDRVYDGTNDGLELWIGHDDGYRIYWNGTQIAENNVQSVVSHADGEFDKIVNAGWTGDLYTLQPGWNHLMVKLNNITGGYGMFVRLVINDPITGAQVGLTLPTAVAEP